MQSESQCEYWMATLNTFRLCLYYICFLALSIGCLRRSFFFSYFLWILIITKKNLSQNISCRLRHWLWLSCRTTSWNSLNKCTPTTNTIESELHSNHFVNWISEKLYYCCWVDGKTRKIRFSQTAEREPLQIIVSINYLRTTRIWFERWW